MLSLASLVLRSQTGLTPVVILLPPQCWDPTSMCHLPVLRTLFTVSCKPIILSNKIEKEKAHNTVPQGPWPPGCLVQA